MANRTNTARTARPTADAILAAACRVIVRRGVDATRISDIAREAGTSTGTVHYYFETKEDVLLAALKWANEQPTTAWTSCSTRRRTTLSAAGDASLELSIPYPGLNGTSGSSSSSSRSAFSTDRNSSPRARPSIPAGGGTSTTLFGRDRDGCVPAGRLVRRGGRPPRRPSIGGPLKAVLREVLDDARTDAGHPLPTSRLTSSGISSRGARARGDPELGAYQEHELAPPAAGVDFESPAAGVGEEDARAPLAAGGGQTSPPPRSCGMTGEGLNSTASRWPCASAPESSTCPHEPLR